MDVENAETEGASLPERSLELRWMAKQSLAMRKETTDGVESATSLQSTHQRRDRRSCIDCNIMEDDQR